MKQELFPKISVTLKESIIHTKNGNTTMKSPAYSIFLLTIALVLASLVSADTMNGLNTPGQLNPPDMANGSSQSTMTDLQKSVDELNNHQSGKQNPGQPTPAETQSTPKASGSQTGRNPDPGTGSQITKQPVATPTTPEPRKNDLSGQNSEVTPGELISPTVQPTQNGNEPGKISSAPSSNQAAGQYQNIQFPRSYPHFIADNAAIQVTSTPTRAGVYLDGSYKGTTPTSGYLEISDLSPGTYTICLTYPGYTDYSTEITVSRNECATIFSDLTKEYVPSSYGALSVQSSPSGADVYLDNEYKGITPVTFQQVATGSHVILIQKDGYSSYSGDVNIVSDQASGLSTTLTAIPTQTPTILPTQTPAPAPTQSPLSTCVSLCSLVMVGVGIAIKRMRQ